MTQVTIGGGRVVCEMDEAAQDEYKQVVGWLQKIIDERDALREELVTLARLVVKDTEEGSCATCGHELERMSMNFVVLCDRCYEDRIA